MTKETNERDIAKLANEFIYHKYLFGKNKLNDFFHDLSIHEYIILYMMKENKENGCEKTYLKDLSEKMQVAMSHMSKMIGDLKEQGLLLWTHDGDGSEGTYVTITDFGEKMLDQHENTLKEYFENVIHCYGKENLVQLLSLMRELDSVMKKEFRKIDGEQV